VSTGGRQRLGERAAGVVGVAGGQGERLDLLGEVRLERGPDHPVPVAEPPVDGRDPDPGAPGDLVEGQRRAALAQDRDRGPDDLV
jgi:hypothetical protein